MDTKRTAFGTYTYEEIISRFISLTSPFEGPSCFPVDITFQANNQTCPPAIYVRVHNFKKDGMGVTEVIFECCIDSDTPLSAFDEALNSLAQVRDRIMESLKGNIPYEDILKQNRIPEEDDLTGDLPF